MSDDLAACVCRTHPYHCPVHPVGGTEFAFTEAERRAMRRKAMSAFATGGDTHPEKENDR